MSKVQTKTRGVANTADNILFIYYFVELFSFLFWSEKGTCTHTLHITFINIFTASVSQHEQHDLMKDIPVHGRGIGLGDL